MQTVLIIEDNFINRRVAEEVLRAKGYNVLTTDRAEEALPIIQSQRPDVVLMDIQLPGMDGITALQHLRTDPVWRTTKVIAVTAATAKGHRERILAGGFDGYVAKPFTPEQLLEAIRAVLA